MRTGKEPPHGSGPEELAATAARAEQAAERLRHALEASADAHDRAADAYEEQVHRFGGTCLGYASHHGRTSAHCGSHMVEDEGEVGDRSVRPAPADEADQPAVTRFLKPTRFAETEASGDEPTTQLAYGALAPQPVDEHDRRWWNESAEVVSTKLKLAGIASQRRAIGTARPRRFQTPFRKSNHAIQIQTSGTWSRWTRGEGRSASMTARPRTGNPTGSTR